MRFEQSLAEPVHLRIFIHIVKQRLVTSNFEGLLNQWKPYDEYVQLVKQKTKYPFLFHHHLSQKYVIDIIKRGILSSFQIETDFLKQESFIH